MLPVLVSLAGKSRAGKGTCAAHFSEWAAEAGYSSFERQLSDNGKWHLARIFHPTISREQAVSWWETIKPRAATVQLRSNKDRVLLHEVPLQKFIQHALQEGGRDIFGEDFWTDMILPDQARRVVGNTWRSEWEPGFFDDEALKSVPGPTNLAIISDLRQVNEAERVRQCGGIVIEIRRPDVQDGYVTGNQHITEQGLPTSLVDYYLHSTGDLGYFEEIALKLFDEVVLPRLEINA